MIALIGFFNIINNIAMSVSARMREYGAMRAIGMTVRQLNRMVLGETMTYTVFGVLLGCVIGLPLNKVLFQNLVTSRWGDEWSVGGKKQYPLKSIIPTLCRENILADIFIYGIALEKL